MIATPKEQLAEKVFIADNFENMYHSGLFLSIFGIG